MSSLAQSAPSSPSPSRPCRPSLHQLILLQCYTDIPPLLYTPSHTHIGTNNDSKNDDDSGNGAVDVNELDEQCFTPLMRLCSRYSLDASNHADIMAAIQSLVDHPSTDLTITNRASMTALSIACHNGECELVELLYGTLIQQSQLDAISETNLRLCHLLAGYGIVHDSRRRQVHRARIQSLIEGVMRSRIMHAVMVSLSSVPVPLCGVIADYASSLNTD